MRAIAAWVGRLPTADRVDVAVIVLLGVLVAAALGLNQMLAA